MDPLSKGTGEVSALQAEAAISFKDISKVFTSRAGATPVIDRLNLEIGEGEFFSLLGPSGCGKTTALRMIAGFEHPTDGELLLGRNSVAGIPPHMRDVNIVFQSYALFPHMDVYDNIEYGLRRKGVARLERRRRVEEVLDLVQLRDLSKRRPAALSGGQQQRVALARALVNRPRVLLLDEPLAALDAKLRATMQTELRRIQQDVGITFVFVTHDQHEAFAMSDRIAILNAGRLEQVGSPTDLYHLPASRFVADFVGQSNFFTGTVSMRGDRRLIEIGDDEFIWLPDHGEQGANTVLVRPENVDLVPRGTELRADLCRVGATVMGRQFLGSHHCIMARTARGEIVTCTSRIEDAAVAPGAEVWVTWHPDHSTIIPDQPGVTTNLKMENRS
ncbi:ABC transporter ATP-binding protein [Mesorhizobium sp.]|uniref:ABC transporter ATP-binding protein n=1 Tax=Mesorhizobium sp. TaxID=1871066 RepID=UPI0025D7486C|nr:ABC transporter ATP-binding protein [Mesorhizobium sp.]